MLLTKLAVRRAPAQLQFAVFFTILTALPTLANEWGDISIVPQPKRYHLEMELGLALLAGLLLDNMLRRVPDRPALLTATAVLLALVWPLKLDRHYARDTLIRTVDITTTSEWRTAQWLNQHWRGGRVMLPGSSAFWLTAFSDQPQIGGGFDQGATIPVYLMAKYEIGSGEAAGSHTPTSRLFGSKPWEFRR